MTASAWAAHREDPPRGADLLAQLMRTSGGQIERHVGFVPIGGVTGGAPTPGDRLVEGERVAGGATAASWDDRADFVCTLAALVRAIHGSRALVGGAWPELRWVDGHPPAPWLPLAAAAPVPSGHLAGDPTSEPANEPTRGPSAVRATRGTDRADLARTARLLLTGSDCAPQIASLIRRSTYAPSAAPLPIEWVLALRGRVQGRPDPVPWVHLDTTASTSGPVRLTVVLLDTDTAVEPIRAPWAQLPRTPLDRFIVLAGRHAERLVLPLHGPGIPGTDLAPTQAVRLEPGPELEASVHAHTLEAALLLEADGIILGSLDIQRVGSRSTTDTDLAGLRAALQALLVG